MPLVVKDRVLETSTTTGTGTLTLAGAQTGYQTFSSAIGNTNTTYYAITNGAEWEVGIGTVGAGTLSRDSILESSNSGSAVNFSAGSKNVFCTYPAEKSVDIDTAQTLTNKTISVDNNTVSGIAASSFVLSNSSGNIDGVVAQKAIPTGAVVGTTDTQTLSNKTLSSPSVTGSITFSDNSTQSTAASGFGFKNRIINGAMQIDQRNAGASGTAQGYTLDRWNIEYSSSGKLTWQQNAGAVTPATGFTNYLGVRQAIEGFNVADLGWGTANAQAVTISFWVRSSITGTWSVVLRNSAGSRSYPATYTVSAANTWEQKTITIPGDTTGTWLTNNGVGIWLIVGLANGSSNTTTAGAWATGQYSGAAGANSLVGTSGATFYITGVQLEKGSTATSFDYRPYGTELALCQRYYQTVSTFIGYGVSATGVNGMVTSIVPMRASASYGLTGVYSISDYFSLDHTQSSATLILFTAAPAGAAIGLTSLSGITSARVYLTRFLNSNQITMSAEL
jgi:hypothetical protein